jgi:uncharacterized membrane protein
VNYNPYAAPQAPVPPPPHALAYGQPQAWTAGEALSIAWSRFKESGVVLVLSVFLFWIIAGIAGQLPNLLTLADGFDSVAARVAITVASFLLQQVVGAFFEVGLTRIWLDTARAKTPELGTLFSGADRFLPILVVNLLVLLCVVLGFVLLIVPAVIVWLGLSLAKFYVVDAGMGPMEAMKASWTATRGQKGELFLLMLAGFGLGLLGILMCCVGILATTPIYYVATAIAFTRISGLGVAPPPEMPYGGGGGYAPPAPAPPV